MTSALDRSPAVNQDLQAAFDAAGDGSDRIPSLATVVKGAPARASARYPEALLRFVDRLVGTLAESRRDEDRREARRLALRCLKDVTPAADLSAVPVRILEAMLWEVDTRADLRTTAPALREVLLGVIDLQRRRADRLDVAKGDWAALRERAMSLTDGFEDPTLSDAGLTVESAAWDLAASSGVLIDILGPYTALIAREAVRATGWTADDGQRAETMLQGIFDETEAQREAGEDVSIPALFRERHPDLARRYVEHLDTRVASGRVACRGLLDQVLTLLAGAPVVAPTPAGA